MRWTLRCEANRPLRLCNAAPCPRRPSCPPLGSARFRSRALKEALPWPRRFPRARLLFQLRCARCAQSCIQAWRLQGALTGICWWRGGTWCAAPLGALTRRARARRKRCAGRAHPAARAARVRGLKCSDGTDAEITVRKKWCHVLPCRVAAHDCNVVRAHV